MEPVTDSNYPNSFNPIGITPVAVSICVLLFTFVSAKLHRAGPVCLSRSLLHIPCPGCGITRSLQSLWLGNLELSFQFHPLGIPVFLLCFGVILYWLFAKQSGIVRSVGESFATFFRPPRRKFGAVIVYISIYLIRMTLDYSGNHFFRW